MKNLTMIRFFSLSFIILLSYHGVRDFEKFPNYLRLMKSKEVLEQAINELKKRNQDLEIEIEKIRNSKSYAQKVLRERYHLTEESEKIIFFSD